MVILRLHQKGGWCVFGYVQLGSDGEVFAIEVRRINQNAEIGAQVGIVIIVRFGIRTLLVAVARHRRQMRARRKAHYANSIRVDIPLRGVRTRVGNGTLQILKRRLVLLQSFAARHPILHQHTIDTEAVESFANFRPFQIIRQNVVSTPGIHNNGCSRIVIGRRRIECQRGFAHIADAKHGATGHFGARIIVFLLQSGCFARRVVRKKQNGWLLSHSIRENEKEE